MCRDLNPYSLQLSRHKEVPNVRIEESVQVERNREEVFQFLTDLDNLPKWQTGVIQSERISDGPVRVGFQFAETAKVGPLKLHNICTVTDLRPNLRFSFQAKSSGPLDFEGSFELQPLSGGTRLTVMASAHLKGLWRLLQPLLAGDLKKETRRELQTLKDLVEQGEARSNERKIAGLA
jgi:carbon monoxide dehydrogenase subunit G